MRIIVAFLISLILLNNCFGSSANARDLDPQETCGSPNEEIGEDLKGKLDAKAQTLARLGSAQLAGEIQKTRKEIMVRENRSDASRFIQYLIVVSCQVIVSDDKLTTDEKLSRIATLKHISQQPYDQSEKQKGDQRQAQTYGRRLTKDMLIASRESRAGGIRFFDPPLDTVIVNNRSFRADLQLRHPGTYVFRLDKSQQRLRVACALSDEIRKGARYFESDWG
jgi:hypothetical protein